jgi:hypothetical protein
MPITELNDLLGLLGNDQDRAAFEQIVERNSGVRARLHSQDLIYKGVLEGDQNAIDQLAQQARTGTGQVQGNGAQGSGAAAVPVTQPNAAAASASTPAAAAASVAFDMARLEALLDSKLSPLTARLDKELAADRLEAAFDQFAQKKMPSLLGDARAVADELYLIRDTHKAEFGENLVRADLEKFVADHPNMYKTWAEAHDAFVQDKRVAKKIEDGVKAGIAAQQTQNVPGTTIPTTSRLNTIFAANPANKANGEARGTGLDAAAAAFRALRQNS